MIKFINIKDFSSLEDIIKKKKRQVKCKIVAKHVFAFYPEHKSLPLNLRETVEKI